MAHKRVLFRFATMTQLPEPRAEQAGLPGEP